MRKSLHRKRMRLLEDQLHKTKIQVAKREEERAKERKTALVEQIKAAKKIKKRQELIRKLEKQVTSGKFPPKKKRQLKRVEKRLKRNIWKIKKRTRIRIKRRVRRIARRYRRKRMRRKKKISVEESKLHKRISYLTKILKKKWPKLPPAGPSNKMRWIISKANLKLLEKYNKKTMGTARKKMMEREKFDDEQEKRVKRQVEMWNRAYLMNTVLLVEKLVYKKHRKHAKRRGEIVRRKEARMTEDIEGFYVSNYGKGFYGLPKGSGELHVFE